MHRTLPLRATLVAALLGSASCGDPSGTDARIESVDMLLAQVCQLAADCPGVSATPQDLQDCPLGIRSQLGPAEIAELEQFITLSTARQHTVLECVGRAICSRFGGGLGSISDSDLMEPYRECLASA
jgi:hypothetical protein